MRRLDYLKMNTALWKNIGTEHHYNLSGWLNAAAGLEENLRELDGELSEFGGIGFVSQDEHTDKIIEILTVLSDCRLWLDKDIEDYVDRPLKEIFNALDDQLASIDARKIKTPNLAGDKIAVGRDEYGEPCSYAQIAPQMLTLEDFTGNSMGEIQGYLIYNQKIEGFADIMEERYNYTVTDAESEISYRDYTQWYEPSESYFKKDVSFWTRAAQTAWSATGIGDFVDAALGYELITGDMNTLKESNWKVVEGMFETALLCLPGVMNAGGGGKAVLCAVGKELGENMVMDTMYEAMEAGGCSEARSILNAVLIFRTVYSFVDMANSAVNAKNLRDAYKDKDWTDWVKRAEGT